MFNVASDVFFWYPKQKAWQSAGVTSESEVRMRTNKQTQDIAWKVDDEKERAVILRCHVRDRRDCQLQSGCALFKQAQKRMEAKLLEKFRTKTTKALDGVKEELKGAGWMKSSNEVSDSPFRHLTHENRASMPLLSRFTCIMHSVTM
jgi:hypothetical protein